jgi:hypothetical protein
MDQNRVSDQLSEQLRLVSPNRNIEALQLAAVDKPE